MTFDELGLSEALVAAVTAAGYKEPTPIQEQAIPVVLMGRDVLGVAQTGTGKTAAFTLPMIEILSGSRAKARMPRSLILTPTRELAAQISEAFETHGKQHKLTMALLIGGESMADQRAVLDRGVDVLIATPGRLLDLFERGRILLNDVKILVIDEADRMLDMGFIPDVERIVSLLPKIRQTLFFSATMAPEIRRLGDAFLMNPKEISVAPPASAASTVIQAMVVVDEIDKREALRHLLRTEDVKNAIIFSNRKRDVDVLFRSLARHGFDAAPLHGDMPQPARTETLEKFRRNEVKLLVCSDVAARGLDISNVSHVFNFDVPHHSEDYVHRIGRTGRAGREGRAFSIAEPSDGKFIAAIEALIGTSIPRIEIEGLATVELDMNARPGRGRSAAAGKSGGRGRPEPKRERDHGGSREARPPRESRPPREARPVHEETPPPEVVQEARLAREPRPPREETREARPPREERPARAERPPRDESRDARPPRQDSRPPREPRPRRDDSGPSVVGFGDDLPAFMRAK